MESTLKPKLLIVDDEVALRTSYKLILEQKGYAVETAESSDEAERKLAADHFDALLCDFGLDHQRNGMEVILWARQRDPHLACVLLTGYPDSALSDQAQQAGADTLYKPVEIPKLLDTLDFVLRRHKNIQHSRTWDETQRNTEKN